MGDYTSSNRQFSLSKLITCSDCGYTTRIYYLLGQRPVCQDCHEKKTADPDPRQAQMPDREKGLPEREKRPL